MSIKDFFVRLFESLAFSKDPNKIKKRKLAKVAKSISKSRFSRWYKSTGFLTKDMASFFYDIYKLLGPAQVLFQAKASTSMLQLLTVYESLSENQKKLIEDLSEEKIILESKTKDYKTLKEELDLKISNLDESFSDLQTEKINQIYYKIKQFRDLVCFDYYYFLKQFGFNLPELDFYGKPFFKDAVAISLLDSLNDFLDIITNFPFDSNWKEVFSIIEKYKNIKPVNFLQWQKTEQALKSVGSSFVLENIIRHITENPDEVFRFETNVTDIVKNYINKILKTTEKILVSIQKEKQYDKVQLLKNKIFLTERPLSVTKNYVVNSPLFKNTQLLGFIYAEPLSYLKSFLTEYLKTEIKAVSELFLVRAIWKNKDYSKDYSESYHELFSIIENIVHFDENLKEGDPLFMKIKASISRASRDTVAKNFVIRKLNELNAQAYKFIVTACNNLARIAKLFSLIIEDYDNPQRTLLENWNEIEENASVSLKDLLIRIHSKIINFIDLQQILLSEKNNNFKEINT